MLIIHYLSSMIIIFNLIVNFNSSVPIAGMDKQKEQQRNHHKWIDFLKLIKVHSPIKLCEHCESDDEFFGALSLAFKHTEFEVSQIGTIEMANWMGIMKGKPAVKCECGREILGKMVPVTFFEENEHKISREENFLVDREPLGEGGFAKVYHGTKIPNDWNFHKYDRNLPKNENENGKKCFAIKVAKMEGRMTKAEAAQILEKEKLVLEEIWDKKRWKVLPKHLIRLRAIRNHKIKNEKNEIKNEMVIMLEIGQADLDTVWAKAMANFWSFSAQSKEQFLMEIARQILTGIYEFHERDRILMDFKPQNIIVMRQNGPLSLKFLQLKLVDFADSIKVQGPKNQPQNVEIVTTSWQYAGPEIYLTRGHYEISQKTDIWSFAAVCLELLLMTSNFAKQLSSKKFAKAVLGKDFSGDEKYFSKTEKWRWSHNIRKKMIDWVYLGRDEEKNMELENLDKELRKKYPKMMEMLKDCFKFKQEDRPNAAELLQKYFKMKMEKMEENIAIPSPNPTNTENFKRILTEGNSSRNEIFQQETDLNELRRTKSLPDELFIERRRKNIG